MLRIEYTAADFPNGAPLTNGDFELDVDWADILWAAITIGRPNLHFVFQHGISSFYEALFRVSLVRMTLEQSGPAARRLRRTAAARSLDPSEKGAVNYFLGMVLCKLMASQRFDTPWLLHLDVFRGGLNPTFFTGRSRPDLVGASNAGRWLSFESKGRVSAPTRADKEKAKAQARRCRSVSGVDVTFHLAGITYFKNDVLRFFCADPEPAENGFGVGLTDDSWRHYYEPALQLVLRGDSALRDQDLPSPVPEADFQLQIHPAVLRLLLVERWSAARQWCIDNPSGLHDFRVDGIKVIAGDSWRNRFSSTEE